MAKNAGDDRKAESDLEGSLIETGRGPIEYISAGKGPTILGLHGGCDQPAPPVEIKLYKH